MPINRRQLLAALPALPAAAAAAIAADFPLAPEFTARDPRDWINSAPLRWSELAGRVVLLDIWTFECWNCYRSFPWLRSVEARFAARGLSVVGIHSPEFPAERERENVRAAVKKFELHHPVMIDNDFQYWKALDNQYWPAYYLVDRQHRIRASFFGETHAGDPQAREIESAIERVLAG